MDAAAAAVPPPPVSKPAVATPAPALDAVATPPVPSAPVDPAMAGMVRALRDLSGTNAMMTRESVAAWRTNLLQLVQSGAAAVPALKAFLAENVDYAFSPEGWDVLGFPSARFAAFDALRQIGGPEALGAMESALATTGNPKEIAVLARTLEKSSQGQYRQQALAAARAALAAAGAAKDPQVDVAPLFEVFAHYGDASSVPELERAIGQWKYYATIALANLPDGAGISSILRQADPASTSGNRVVALEMVAQLAAANPDARQALLSQVGNNQISPSLWPYLAAALSGDQYYPVASAITPYPDLKSMSDIKTTHISSGNQNLYTLPDYQSLTVDKITQRIALVDDLLGRVASDPGALRTLQQVRTTLSERLNQAMKQTPPANTTGR
jgi:hypothetical protein